VAAPPSRGRRRRPLIGCWQAAVSALLRTRVPKRAVPPPPPVQRRRWPAGGRWALLGRRPSAEGDIPDAPGGAEAYAYAQATIRPRRQPRHELTALWAPQPLAPFTISVVRVAAIVGAAALGAGVGAFLPRLAYRFSVPYDTAPAGDCPHCMTPRRAGILGWIRRCRTSKRKHHVSLGNEVVRLRDCTPNESYLGRPIASSDTSSSPSVSALRIPARPGGPGRDLGRRT
jgi:hypothetical protein